MASSHSHRKDEHVSLAEKFYQPTATSGFDDVQFIHQSLPEISLNEVSYATHLGPLKLEIPFFIEAMTGGSPKTGQLNTRLSKIAAATGLAMATGSESVALKEPELKESFSVVRQTNPTGLVFGNIGAGHSLEQAQKSVDLLRADALEIHLNTPQELVMPEGDRSFFWQAELQQTIALLPVPVIVKEVGFGMSMETLTQLKTLGATIVDLGGRGGTNFAEIENFRRPKKDLAYLSDWGLTTVQSLMEARMVSGLDVIATGGIRNPLDIVKALALGANAVGIAGALLHLLIHEDDATIIATLNDWKQGVKTIMTLLGVRTLAELQQVKLLVSPNMESYLRQRKIPY
ncbi:type 2 isopentenyl-diphosphate Delta-isomerase [Levilactobacillus bambusae]|uniref:Isopentenyl-diphosphate delta-isomerase n=1 Tax=Levilactobacillus bambusae TaxID=2024736 RepID=A0A2V1N4N0_9LACO|nr:type 2 isopentenyl-diphosphate Delta-isomerase [Levilactobacillus bambusae]PWG00875.1 type 2 isopentenyl-diphosphate Delta-isomerase [Levilactobacillus bambusae]